jgi:hypothetical protein
VFVSGLNWDRRYNSTVLLMMRTGGTVAERFRDELSAAVGKPRVTTTVVMTNIGSRFCENINPDRPGRQHLRYLYLRRSRHVADGGGRSYLEFHQNLIGPEGDTVTATPPDANDSEPAVVRVVSTAFNCFQDEAHREDVDLSAALLVWFMWMTQAAMDLNVSRAAVFEAIETGRQAWIERHPDHIVN